jgi:capsid protein
MKAIFSKLLNSANPFSANLSDLPDMSDSLTGGATPWGTSPTGRGTDAGSFNVRRLQDMLPAERRTTIARSRFIRNRTGLGKAMIEGCGRYAINEGVCGYAATGDTEYDDACNRLCDAIFEAEDDAERFDFAGVHNWYGCQQVIAPGMMTDGDVGVAKILERDGNGRPLGTPKIQIFATEQITDGLSDGSFGAFGSFGAASGWREGVLRDRFGRVEKYRVQQEDGPGYPAAPGVAGLSFVDFSPRDFFLTYDPSRIGMGRGLPWTHHGQDSAVSMMDLTHLEKSAAYLNSFFGAVITTPHGEIPEGFEGEIFTKKFSRTNEKRDGSTASADLTRKYANFMGGALLPVLKEGEKLEMVKNERPSLTFTGFMDWLVNDISWGFGIPPSFVWAIAGRSGPETRLTLSQADWFFRHIMQRMIARFCKPTRDFVIRWGLATGRLNNGRPPRNGASPFLCRWHGPRKITIDERYFYKTWLDRLAQGLGTEEEFYADLGLEASDVRRARVLEVKDWLRLCDENGVPYELVKASMPGQMPLVPGKNQPGKPPGS